MQELRWGSVTLMTLLASPVQSPLSTQILLTARVSLTIFILWPSSASNAEPEVAMLDSISEPALSASERSLSTRFEQNGGKSRWIASGFFLSWTVADVLHKRFHCIAFNKNYCRCLVAWGLDQKGMLYSTESSGILVHNIFWISLTVQCTPNVYQAEALKADLYLLLPGFSLEY